MIFGCEDSTEALPLRLMKFLIFDYLLFFVGYRCLVTFFVLYLEWKTIAEIFQPENQQILCGWKLFCRPSQFSLLLVISLANLTVYDNPTLVSGLVWFSEFFKVIFLYLIYASVLIILRRIF